MLQANYSNIQAYRDTQPDHMIPVLINGDITEFGDKGGLIGPTYLDVMKDDVLPLLGAKDLVLIGLGNHDYDNNVNDTVDNGAAGGMLEWFPDAKPTTTGINFDWRQNFYDGWTGDIFYLFSSYAYAVEKKDPALDGLTYRFIQLNNYPEYASHFETGKLVGDEHIYNVLPSTAWLAGQLEIAGKEGQIVIISSHQQLFDAIKPMLEAANVTLLCVGHSHVISTQIEVDGELSIVNSGASFKGDYLVAEAEGGNLNIFAIKNNDYSAKVLIGTVPLKVASVNFPRDDVGRYVKFIKPEEEWTEGLGACVTLIKKGEYDMRSDSYFNDSVMGCEINRADVGTVISVYDSPSADTDDDYAVITIKKTLTHPILIHSFETDLDTEFLSLRYHHYNGLDGKISRVDVTFI